MTAFLGADTDDVRALATRYAKHGQRLNEVQQEIWLYAQSADWVGPDADSFRNSAANVASTIAQLSSDIAARANELDGEADEQDVAAEPDFPFGAFVSTGTGAWRPGSGNTPDAKGSKGQESKLDEFLRVADDIIDQIIKKKLDDLDEALKRNGEAPWLRFLKKGLPLIPDLIDFANHTVHGESEEAAFALVRSIISITPIGLIDDLSALIFPMMPDSWKLPGTDIPVNEGSFIDGYEKAALSQQGGDDTYIERAIADGEADGMRQSDALGIDNKYIRNVFKTAGGISAGMVASQMDPKDGKFWHIGKIVKPSYWQ